MQNTTKLQARPLVAISSCLLGQRVRYDGEEKRDDSICQQLSGKFFWLPVCPEVAIGMSVPRPAIQLVQDNRSIKVLGVENPDFDVTEKLSAYAAEVAHSQPKVCGYIFKSRSPSCGLGGGDIKNPAGELISQTGIGQFAWSFQQLRSEIPVIDEVDFRNTKLATGFVAAVERRFSAISS